MSTELRTIGFIGLGIMGAPMAANLLKAGYALNVWNRTRAKADALVAAGARWLDDPGAVARASDAVITIVGAPADVEAVWSGGVVAGARNGALVIDMTTSSPSLAVRLHAEAKARGLRALDAPVSGGEAGAKAGTLAIMVGGDPADFAAAEPMLSKMGNKVTWCGPAGSGQRVKLTNQMLIASNITGLAEALAFAGRGRLDPKIALKVLAESTGASRMLAVYGEKIVAGDHAPGFMVEHFVKDMTIALAEAESLGLDARVLRTALAQFTELARRHGGRDGVQSVARLYA